MIQKLIQSFNHNDILFYLFIFCISVYFINVFQINVYAILIIIGCILLHKYYKVETYENKLDDYKNIMSITNINDIKYIEILDLLNEIMILKKYNPYTIKQIIHFMQQFLHSIENKRDFDTVNEYRLQILNQYSSLIVSIPVAYNNKYTLIQTKLFNLLKKIILTHYKHNYENAYPLKNNTYNNNFDLFI